MICVNYVALNGVSITEFLKMFRYYVIVFFGEGFTKGEWCSAP